MSRFYKRKLTEAELQAKEEKKQRLQSFVDKVASMSDLELEELKERIDIVTCEGHSLSLRNCMMLDLEAKFLGINVSMVGGYNQWLKVNRQVKKGAKANLDILVPCTYNEKDKDGNVILENGEAKKQQYFKWVSVFDISQTEIKTEIILETELLEV